MSLRRTVKVVADVRKLVGNPLSLFLNSFCFFVSYYFNL